MSTDNNQLFPPATPESAKKKADLAPAQIKTWRKFSRSVFKEGALDEKTKQLIAVAVAHVTQCPYCIKAHTKGSKNADATNEEIMEAIWVAAAGRASGAYSNAVIAVNQMEENEDKDNDGGTVFPEVTNETAAKKAKLAPEIVESWRNFSNVVFKAGKLSEKVKQLIALGVSHVTQCPYCIKGHTKMAKVKGATNQEIMEAIWVAAEMRAGAAYAHAGIALDEMESIDEKELEVTQ